MKNDYYVYTLAYPDGVVFYVGKGRHDRIDDHEREARKGVTSHKCNVIRQIWAKGERIIKTKVKEGMSEEDAYQLEIDLICRYGRAKLTNLTDGGEGGNGGAREGAGRPLKSYKGNQGVGDTPLENLWLWLAEKRGEQVAHEAHLYYNERKRIYETMRLKAKQGE